MKALEVLIVDDEPLARGSVARQVAATLPDARVREARDGFAALDSIRDLPPDLLFLDVEMPELSGLDLLRQLPHPRPKVVFVTAFEHFAVGAFEENACDYLVKPFTPARFATAVGRALAELHSEAKLGDLERTLTRAGHELERLALRRGGGFDVVPLHDVVCLLSKDHYTYVHAAAEEYITELSLAHFEERLPPAQFVRAHRTALINADRVVRIVDDAALFMDNGMEVPLSRRNRGPLLKICRDHISSRLRPDRHLK